MLAQVTGTEPGRPQGRQLPLAPLEPGVVVEQGQAGLLADGGPHTADTRQAGCPKAF